MAITKITPGSETFNDFYTKFNNNVDKMVVGAITTSNTLQLQLYDGTLLSVTNSMPFVKGAGAGSVRYNDATNTSAGANSAVGGGTNNTASAVYTKVGGGFNNSASFQYASILGGLNNTSSGNASTVGGGINNAASGGGAVIAGGASNQASATYAGVLCGLQNVASHNYSSVLAGSGVTTSEASTAYAKNFAVGDGGYLKTKSGSNQIAGKATLVGGTVTVSNTLVDANSIIMLTHQTNAGTPGFVSITAVSNGTSFTITSSSGSDTSVIGYMIINTY